MTGDFQRSEWSVDFTRYTLFSRGTYQRTDKFLMGWDSIQPLWCEMSLRNFLIVWFAEI